MFNDAVSQTVDETWMAIRRCSDVVTACLKGQALAKQFGLSGDNQVNVILAILNAVDKIARSSGYGKVILSSFWQDNKHGVIVRMDDQTTWKILERSETRFVKLLENRGNRLLACRRKAPEIVLQVSPFEHTE